MSLRSEHAANLALQATQQPAPRQLRTTQRAPRSWLASFLLALRGR